RNVTIDTVMPDITINSPISQTYSDNFVWFNITATDSFTFIDWCSYSLDSAPYQSLPNTASDTYAFFKNPITEGPHSIVFRCADIAGNIRTIDALNFLTNRNPVIAEVTINDSIINPYDTVKISATITDADGNMDMSSQNIEIRYPNGTVAVPLTSMSCTGDASEVLCHYIYTSENIIGDYTVYIEVKDITDQSPENDTYTYNLFDVETLSIDIIEIINLDDFNPNGYIDWNDSIKVTGHIKNDKLNTDSRTPTAMTAKIYNATSMQYTGLSCTDTTSAGIFDCTIKMYIETGDYRACIDTKGAEDTENIFNNESNCTVPFHVFELLLIDDIAPPAETIVHRSTCNANTDTVELKINLKDTSGSSITGANVTF
ncbi:MAG: hypothetical protein KAR23_02060, partial [Candidatus Aenigmarchaeota archaeon]|nr:hypothetical protein [Candidatus Aenigmarchaeota archaeon]